LPRRALATSLENMPRHIDHDIMLARKEIADVIEWADRQGFVDIAATLRRARDLLPQRPRLYDYCVYLLDRLGPFGQWREIGTAQYDDDDEMTVLLPTAPGIGSTGFIRIRLVEEGPPPLPLDLQPVPDKAR